MPDPSPAERGARSLGSTPPHRPRLAALIWCGHTSPANPDSPAASFKLTTDVRSCATPERTSASFKLTTDVRSGVAHETYPGRGLPSAIGIPHSDYYNCLVRKR